jgi:hypothetical protein
MSRLNPDLPPPELRLNELVDRVWRFSLGGILALRSPATGLAPPAAKPGLSGLGV